MSELASERWGSCALTHLGGRALAGLLPDLAVLPGPRYLALARAVAALILDGRVAPATRLPSERELAGSLGLSRATVTTAYDALRAGGFLASRTGSGSVATLPSRAAVAAGSTRWTIADAPVGRRPTSGTLPGDVLDLVSATLPAPQAALSEAVAAAAEQLPALADAPGYDPVGLPALREALARRFTERGVATHPDQILVSNGALHGFDLVLRLMTGPGDRVLTELPTYSGLLDAVRGSGIRPVPVPVSPRGGWQVAAMVAALRQSAPRLAVVIPDFHNPTGALVPDADRAEFLRAARRAGTTVVVDESFVELSLSDDPVERPTTPMAALDPAVVTVGSLSKPFWGGLRIGWIRAARETIRRLSAVRAGIDMGGAVLEQLVATRIVGRLDEIVVPRRQQVRRQRDTLLNALAQRLPTWHTSVAAGGLSLWVELDAPLGTALCMTAPAYGVRLAPGSRFGTDGTLERFLRVPFSLPEDQLRIATDRLARAWNSLDRRAADYSPLIVA